MYQAELKGKLSAGARDSEDILTSNVFSFFKYARREVYLKKFLEGLELSPFPTDSAIERAEFDFWPNYDDGTQPDLVVQVGQHYLLFEMKLNSEVGHEDDNPSGQLIHEINEGRKEAKRRELSFKLIFVSADTLYPDYVLKNIHPELRRDVKWLNWQFIAGLVLPFVENPGDVNQERRTPDLLFVEDLYRLLDHKHLRGFLSFERLCGHYTYPINEKIFFAAETSKYRGDFIGFAKALFAVNEVQSSPAAIFYSAKCFDNYPNVESFDNRAIFYQKEPQ